MARRVPRVGLGVRLLDPARDGRRDGRDHVDRLRDLARGRPLRRRGRGGRDRGDVRGGAGGARARGRRRRRERRPAGSGPMVRLAGHGLAVEVHPGWEARVWQPDVAAPAVPGAVVRLANFPLPVTKNTYAAEVADDLRPGDVLVSLVELDPALADRGLYAGQGVPRVRADELDPRAIQAAGPGRLGVQRFFSLHGRAFGLYVMAREGPRLELSLRALNASLRSLTVGVG